MHGQGANKQYGPKPPKKTYHVWCLAAQVPTALGPAHDVFFMGSKETQSGLCVGCLVALVYADAPESC